MPLKLWPSLLGMSHGNFLVKAAEDSIGSQYLIGEGVLLLLLLLVFDDGDP